MADTLYSNGELAILYRSFLNASGKDAKYYNRTINAIQTADVPIQRFYQEHGGLEKLDVLFVGPKAKRALELLLQHGLEQAIEACEQEKIEDMRRASQKRAWPSYDQGQVTRGAKRQKDLRPRIR